MSMVGQCIRLLARSCEFLGSGFYRLAHFFGGFLPVLFSSEQLSSLVRNNYRSVYSNEQAQRQLAEGEQYLYLEPWETEVLDRYKVHSGSMLVLGSGWGRESIAIARRGVTVVGVDANEVAMHTVQQVAQKLGVPAHFHQADFLELPYAAASFDYALLSATMYSAIPGQSRRQTFLADLGRLLKPDGLAILSFAPEQRPVSRTKTICTRLNTVLAKLPGTNPAYQPGDDCGGGHFMHTFQDEDEIRQELMGAGVSIRELNWARGYAVVAYPPGTVKARIS